MKNETTMSRTESVTTEAKEEIGRSDESTLAQRTGEARTACKLLTRKAILLVDNDAAVRESIARVLESEGYDVLLARNGWEAIARFVSLKPDLVLLDLIM